MFSKLFRKLPYQSLDETFWYFLDDAEKNKTFCVFGQKLNLTKALDNQFRAPILDYLLAEYSYFHQSFDFAADLINNFNANIISREGPYWKVSYDVGVVLEVQANAFCELRGLIYSAFEEGGEDAKEMLIQSIHSRLSSRRQISSNREVYSFRPISKYALADLQNRTITVGSPLMMNDPFDSPYYDIQKRKRETIKEVYRKFCRGNEENYKRLLRGLELEDSIDKYYRIRCFVEDIPSERINPLNRVNMWGVYADSAKGMCVKYSFSPKFQDYQDGEEIRYLHKVTYVDSFEIDPKKSTTLEEAFFLKNSSWKHENEVRLLSFNPKSNEPFVSIPLDDDSRVTDVYFGLNCSEEDKDRVINALGYSDANYHSMEKDASNYYVPTQYQHMLYYKGKDNELDILNKWFGEE